MPPIFSSSLFLTAPARLDSILIDASPTQTFFLVPKYPQQPYSSTIGIGYKSSKLNNHEPLQGTTL